MRRRKMRLRKRIIHSQRRVHIHSLTGIGNPTKAGCGHTQSTTIARIFSQAFSETVLHTLSQSKSQKKIRPSIATLCEQGPDLVDSLPGLWSFRAQIHDLGAGSAVSTSAQSLKDRIAAYFMEGREACNVPSSPHESTDNTPHRLLRKHN